MNISSTPLVKSVRLPTGLQLEYAEQGRRGETTVLMIHGITDSWRSFEPVMPWLPRDWHVISLSQRGHGGSDKTSLSYRTRDFAADIAAFARALDLPAMLVVGHSMGAANAMRLAIDRPDLVRGLVAAGAFASFGDKPELVDFVRSAIAPLTDPVPRALAQGFQEDTIESAIASDFLDMVVDESLRVPASVWRSAFSALLDDDFTHELHRITAPTLLPWGDADKFVPRADQERLEHIIPNARRSIYRGVGHALHWEQPERFAFELVRFASSLRVESSSAV